MKIGQQVTVLIRGAGVVSNETWTVGKISNGKIWLDSGPGNDPMGPFDLETGRYRGHTFPGFSMKLQMK